MYLSRNGFLIAGEAKDGEEAVLKYKECQPDIVTLDITMPKMNGLDALREIINIDKNARVIMVTSMGQEFMVVEAVKYGAKNFIVKPFKEQDVVDTVNMVLKRF